MINIFDVFFQIYVIDSSDRKRFDETAEVSSILGHGLSHDLSNFLIYQLFLALQ